MDYFRSLALGPKPKAETPASDAATRAESPISDIADDDAPDGQIAIDESIKAVLDVAKAANDARLSQERAVAATEQTTAAIEAATEAQIRMKQERAEQQQRAGEDMDSEEEGKRFVKVEKPQEPEEEETEDQGQAGNQVQMQEEQVQADARAQAFANIQAQMQHEVLANTQAPVQTQDEAQNHDNAQTQAQTEQQTQLQGNTQTAVQAEQQPHMQEEEATQNFTQAQRVDDAHQQMEEDPQTEAASEVDELEEHSADVPLADITNRTNFEREQHPPTPAPPAPTTNPPEDAEMEYLGAFHNPLPSPPPPEVINIALRDANNYKTFFRCKPTTKLSKLFRLFADRFSLELGKVRFISQDGKQIPKYDPRLTIESMGLKDEDEIDVMLEQIGGLFPAGGV